MSQKNFRRYVFVSSALALLLVFAGESPGEDLIAQGDALWKQRDTVEGTRGAIAAWEAAAKVKNRDADLWIKIAVGYYQLGELAAENDNKTKLEVCKKGLEAIKQALNINPENLAAVFWKMVIQGRLTEAKGLLSGFDFGNAIRSTIFVASRDHTFYHGGIYRFWGRVMYQIPPVVGRFFKFRPEDSVGMYEQTMKISPYFFQTRLYLAETYIKMKDLEKAKKNLEWIVNTDPEKLPECAPENRVYQKRAKTLLATISQ